MLSGQAAELLSLQNAETNVIFLLFWTTIRVDFQRGQGDQKQYIFGVLAPSGEKMQKIVKKGPQVKKSSILGAFLVSFLAYFLGRLLGRIFCAHGRQKAPKWRPRATFLRLILGSFSDALEK